MTNINGTMTFDDQVNIDMGNTTTLSGNFAGARVTIQARMDRLREQAGAHWAQATDVAAALVEENGWPWRVAHQVTAILVRLSEERDIPPREVTPELLDEASSTYHGEAAGLSAATLEDALDPERFVARRTLYGGPAPVAASEELAEHRQRLEADETRRLAAVDRLQGAAARLESAIDVLLG
jgi:argininosuccinate lyase